MLLQQMITLTKQPLAGRAISYGSLWNIRGNNVVGSTLLCKKKNHDRFRWCCHIAMIVCGISVIGLAFS
jgi:hypothetical protein